MIKLLDQGDYQLMETKGEIKILTLVLDGVKFVLAYRQRRIGIVRFVRSNQHFANTFQRLVRIAA